MTAPEWTDAALTALVAECERRHDNCTGDGGLTWADVAREHPEPGKLWRLCAEQMDLAHEDRSRLLSALRSVRAERARWIPVSEMLPDSGQTCLVTIETVDGPDAGKREVSWDTYDDAMPDGERMGGWSVDCDPDVIVVAWMSMPAPYQLQESAEGGRTP